MLSALAAVAAALVVLPPPAAGAEPCAEQILADWARDGRIDRVYPLPCYEEAIDSLPPDLRDYTDAADVIERALQSAVRSRPTTAAREPLEDGSPSRTGLVLALVGASVTLVVAVGLGSLARRRGSGRAGPDG